MKAKEGELNKNSVKQYKNKFLKIGNRGHKGYKV